MKRRTLPQQEIGQRRKGHGERGGTQARDKAQGQGQVEQEQDDSLRRRAHRGLSGASLDRRLSRETWQVRPQLPEAVGPTRVKVRNDQAQAQDGPGSGQGQKAQADAPLPRLQEIDEAPGCYGNHHLLLGGKGQQHGDPE